MKLITATVLLASIGNTHAFSAPSKAQPVPTTNTDASGNTIDPLLIRAARGETTERVPVWMMRQAGRHIKEYRELCKKYPTFRERSEIPDVAVEVSLQPWRNYQTDGCILFSDILTPLPGMGVEFDIDEKVGPVVKPMRTAEDVKKVRRNKACAGISCLHYYFVSVIAIWRPILIKSSIPSSLTLYDKIIEKDASH